MCQAAHLPGIKLALEDLLKLNLMAKTGNEVHGVLLYVTSFARVLMSAVWYKILAGIDICNKVIQARDAILDVEVANIETLLTDLTKLRNNWKCMWNEAKLVVSNLKIEIKLSRRCGGVRRKRARPHDDSTPDANLEEMNDTDDTPEEAYFRKCVLYVLVDNVIAGLTVRFNAVKQLAEKFDFLWKYLTMSESDVKRKTLSLSEQYPAHLNGDEFGKEMQLLPSVHKANFVNAPLKPLDLLNLLTEYRLGDLFPNVCVSLRILLTIPATVASAERSFSKLKLIKNYLRSTMSEERLVDLARLSIESNIAITINFHAVCDLKFFTQKRPGKLFLISQY
ncbi:52 kDa repressor of the inhibitor of the protein kinase-like [Hemicordylus capensis]|uniref:52 kDa repressor of the inhibitor of the protein kinase-like n=1 Tax=Hemicordylus capensis TaxID=884348 RepID=UPI002304AA81|nr:52 kDa repressor of the inhibitor of the protein kinase-like [Hemicordylus capensis]XP_053167421.1 52 kDa repressor of the inhibitor of the protein kinase-like [Hemicordylus capensis]